MKATLQRFKQNDETETKVIAAVMPVLEDIGNELDLFFEEAFSTYQLGDVLYDLGRDPMVGVITRDTFRRGFPAIHNLFTRPGTFEYYLEVFRAIWGENVEIEFSNPDPGVLLINAEVLDLESFNLIAREIVDNVYVYNNLVNREGENIAVRDTSGTKNQSEINALINEISPAGIYVETTLIV